MEQIYEKLYEAFVPPWATPEETAAGEAGEPYFDRLCQRFPPQEAEDIWDAALSAGAAGREECFLRGFRLGALLMLDLLSGGDKNALPSPVIGTRAFQTLRGATQIQACGHAPLTLCCGRGTAPVSGPAGGAVFSGAVSVRSFQPRGLSLSGGVPDTHAPSWRWTLSAARAGAGRGNGENVSLRWRRGCGWGSSPRASPSLPGPDRGSAAQRWPRWWPWGRSAGHTAWRWTARCRPALRSGGR